MASLTSLAVAGTSTVIDLFERHDHGLAVLDERLKRERIEQCNPFAFGIGRSLFANHWLAVPEI